MEDNKLLIIAGPTATGKTKLALKLAKQYQGELISADSRQVYQGMDIGTGKDLDKFSTFNLEFSTGDLKIGYYKIDGTKLWLLDIVNPDYIFNVADYQKCGQVVLADIQKRGKLPIIVGGTGFYIKSLTGEIETIGIKPNWELRNNLQKDSIEELQEKLKKINWSKWQTVNQSDRQNPRRLIRAIEVSRTPILKSKLKKMEKINTLYLGLTCPFPYLYKKIDQRVEQRLNEGLENEIQKLLDLGYTWKNSAIGTTLAYFQWQDFFEKRKNKEEIIQRWKYDEHLYSRRQMTWFKKTFSQVRGEWFDISQKNWLEKVEKRFDCWYSDGSAKED